MNFDQIRKLALATTQAKKGAPTNFSYTVNDETINLAPEAMNSTLRKEIQSKFTPGDFNSFEAVKHEIYALIASSIDKKMPPELENWFENFAKVTQYGENDKPEITIKKDQRNLRARAFITKVSPAGVYEVFKLGNDKKTTIEMTAIGGGIQIAFEDFLTGRVDWNEMLEVISLGMEDRIYEEILKTLEMAEGKLPEANKATTANFDAAGLNKVLDTVSIYGTPVIYCTETFAREITEGSDWASESEKEVRRNLGYMANYKGAKIVILPQSFTDETNSVKVVDSSKAYILPSGRQDIFQVALQGVTQVRDSVNEDWSREIMTYKKFGVAAIIYNDMGTYTITSLEA